MRLFRRPARDFVNIGAVDADVVQLVIRIARKLLEYGPVGAPPPEEACNINERIFMRDSVE
jgi:hypothetical protein